MAERNNRLLRILDKYFGIPIVCFLGLTKRKATWKIDLAGDSELDIIIIKTAAIGDTIILSSIIQDIRVSYPKSKITLVCTSNNYQAATLFDGIDRIFIFDLYKPLKSLRNLINLGTYSCLFDFGSWPRINSIISYFIRASYKVGFKRKGMFRHYVYGLAVEHRDDIHEIENYRNLLRALKINLISYLPKIKVNEADFGKEIDIITRQDLNVVIHPFAGGTGKDKKEWPIKFWVETAKQLYSKGCKIYISGSEGDRENADFIEQNLNENGIVCSVLAGRKTLKETALLLSKSSLLITVNTGIMHLAAAVGTPLIAIHGPTSVLRWGPLSEKAVNIVSDLKCSPCLSLGFEYRCETGGCMKTITVEQVVDAAFHILNI